MYNLYRNKPRFLSDVSSRFKLRLSSKMSYESAIEAVVAKGKEKDFSLWYFNTVSFRIWFKSKSRRLEIERLSKDRICQIAETLKESNPNWEPGKKTKINLVLGILKRFTPDEIGKVVKQTFGVRNAVCPICNKLTEMSPITLQSIVKKAFRFPFTIKVKHEDHYFYMNVDSIGKITKVMHPELVEDSEYKEHLLCPVCGDEMSIDIATYLIRNESIPSSILVEHNDHHFVANLDPLGSVTSTKPINRFSSDSEGGVTIPKNIDEVLKESLEDGEKQILKKLTEIHKDLKEVKIDTKDIKYNTELLLQSTVVLMQSAGESYQAIGVVQDEIVSLRDKTDEVSSYTKEILWLVRGKLLSVVAGQESLEEAITDVTKKVTSICKKIGVGRTKMQQLRNAIKSATLEGAKQGVGAGLWYVARIALRILGVPIL